MPTNSRSCQNDTDLQPNNDGYYQPGSSRHTLELQTHLTNADCIVKNSYEMMTARNQIEIPLPTTEKLNDPRLA